MLEEKLENLKNELIHYAQFVETMIQECIDGLVRGDKPLLLKVIEQDEPKANALELNLDEHCTNLIAQFEPKAKSLRTILMILQMSTDLERMADHAENIAHCALDLIDQPRVKELIDIPRMAEEARGMLVDSIRSFTGENARLAERVCGRDTVVDDLRNGILKELIVIMSGDPSTIQRSLLLIRISQNLERIADLSTNIGEDVIFMVEGRIIKHSKKN